MDRFYFINNTFNKHPCIYIIMYLTEDLLEVGLRVSAIHDLYWDAYC